MKHLHDLRTGIVGAGFIGPVHIEALRRLGVRVQAICDQPDRVQASAERLGISQAFGDYAEMVRQPDLDVIHIASPNRYHCQMALAALQAGKHCVCEKPLAMNTRETAKLMAVASKAGTVFAVNYNVRFYAAVLQLRRLVQRGELGQIIHVQGSYFQDWLFKDTDYNWRLLPQEGGQLRAVADIGTHWLDTASFILGSPITGLIADLGIWHSQRKRPLGEVETFAKAGADMNYAVYPVATEDFANILLNFGNGARGNLAVSQVAAGRKNCLRIEIYGSVKSAWWESEHPEVLHFGNRDGSNETAIRGSRCFGPDVAAYSDYPAGHVEGFPDTFKMCFRNIYGSILKIKGTEQLYATAADGHREVAVCEAVIRSHAKRKWIKLNTT